MHTLIVLVGGKSPGLSVHVFSEEGPRVHSAPTVHGAGGNPCPPRSTLTPRSA